ncbi:hypothetical protein BB560_006689 [Smittium megazygosporum]|uniref:Uncharacterized protein n=1 Tax=Smittium megazygosporum TaxID=133381 RepID=A0A2T9Y2I3_9FUNG|nr:hypothetical protein BB560_006689 [Smittium megazygosporum]
MKFTAFSLFLSFGAIPVLGFPAIDNQFLAVRNDNAEPSSLLTYNEGMPPSSEEGTLPDGEAAPPGNQDEPPPDDLANDAQGAPINGNSEEGDAFVDLGPVDTPAESTPTDVAAASPTLNVDPIRTLPCCGKAL